jgi:hypothetical protein
MNTNRFRYYVTVDVVELQEKLPPGKYINPRESIRKGDLLLTQDSYSKKVSSFYIGKTADKFLNRNYLFYRPDQPEISYVITQLVSIIKEQPAGIRKIVDELADFVQDFRDSNVTGDEFNEKYGF